jgi:hypothetical protein
METKRSHLLRGALAALALLALTGCQRAEVTIEMLTDADQRRYAEACHENGGTYTGEWECDF